MISILIRNKNERTALEFLLQVLTTKFRNQYEEIILVDNNSTDGSLQMAANYGCKIIPLDKFGYGIALNLGVENASQPIIVTFSAHCYPINSEFFSNIKKAFEDTTIAGVRPLTTDKDYRNYILGKTAKNDWQGCGLANACGAFRKDLWQEHPFHDTMFAEDKEWTRYFLEKGYDVVFCESFASYHIKRSRQNAFNRYTSEFLGWSLLLGKRITWSKSIKYFFWETGNAIKEFLSAVYDAFKRLFFHISYLLKYKK